MFGLGKNKKKTPPSLLEMKNICLNCQRMPKEDVIRTVGRMLVDSGYVDPSYVEAMQARELTFSTNIGNGIALPHGVEESKKAVKHSGIAVLVFPQGTDWGGGDVKLVIGIAGAGEEHLQVLSLIADRLSEDGAVDRIVNCSAKEIYDLFTGEGEAA